MFEEQHYFTAEQLMVGYQRRIQDTLGVCVCSHVCVKHADPQAVVRKLACVNVEL